jgi:hypothetical protein
MFRKLTQSVCLLLALAAAPCASAFTVWGPLTTKQTADLDYGLRYYYFYVQLLSGLGTTENGGPQLLGNNSRLTTPIVTYAFDQTFLDYFGAQGVAAVNSAMQVLNSLPPASSANLANFITDQNEQINYTAQALDMLDIKSTVLWLMVEHMGLLGETHVYDLLQRFQLAGPPACLYQYEVTGDNTDPVTLSPSDYVNGRLYTYEIWDGCSIGVNVGDAVEYPADSTTQSYTAVATPEGLQLGGYYLGLTRDDMGGLKYLYRKNNYSFQSLDSNTVAYPFSSSWESVGISNAITGISNFTGVLGGVEKIEFVYTPYDSEFGTNFHTRTYSYSIPYVTNFTLGKLQVTRTLTAPDIIFTAANLIAPEAIFNYTALQRTNTFIASGYVSPGGGVVTGTMAAPLLVVLNNAGPVYLNINPTMLGQLPGEYLEYPVFNWGSFNGSANAPTNYPNGASLEELELQVASGAGGNASVYPWAPVGFPTNNNNGSGAGVGVGGVKSLPPSHKKIPQI